MFVPLYKCDGWIYFILLSRSPLYCIRYIEGRALIFCENSKITTCCWTTVDRRMLDPTKKKIPHVQEQRRSPNKMVGGAKSCLESNPIPVRDAERAQTKSCAHQDPETPQRLSQTCIWVSCRGMSQQWPVTRGRGSGCSYLGYTACGISPLGRGHH